MIFVILKIKKIIDVESRFYPYKDCRLLPESGRNIIHVETFSSFFFVSSQTFSNFAVVIANAHTCLFAQLLDVMEGKYLDPKADLTFKKIFGENENLVMSLLNALLPLDEGKQIEHVEYLTPEMVPENPGKKNSIVDVRCRETGGRHFIVEMQMNWNNEFEQRVILNASKAVVKQLGKNEDYSLLQPVYSLNLINDIGFEAGPDEFYHDYAIVNVAHTDRIISGLRFVFVELPKFKPQTIAEKKMAVLWLRFLTEIDKSTEEAPAELLENPDTRQALQILEKSAYNEAELYAYDYYWDAVYNERGAIRHGYKQGMAQGMAQGIEQGLAQGIAQGMAQGMAQGIAKGREEGEAKGRAEGAEQTKRENAHRMKADGMPADLIAKYTGLSCEEIEAL